MKLRAITLSEVRQFTRPVRVAGLGDGLNVLSAPNESGKSTLFDAIQALFFVPHRSRKIEPLKPAVGGNPEITLELEHDGAEYRLHKRWGRGATAEVWQGARLVARGDEAEAWIGALTQPVEDGGPAGLLWVRQGLVALDEGSKKEQDAAQTARRDLMSSVTGEFEALTGGKRMDQALERARDDHDRLMTQRGPKAGGPLDSAVKEAAALEQQVSALNARADQLRLALEQRRAKRRALGELTEPAQVADRAERLAAAQAAMAAAERHATNMNAAATALKAADLAQAAARRDLDARTRTAQAVKDLTAQHAAAETRATQAESRATAAQEALTAALAAQAAARAARQQAETHRDAALTAERQRRESERHAQLAEALRQSRALAATLPGLRAAAAAGPDTRQLEVIDKAAHDLAIAEGLAQAAAPRLTLIQPPGAPPVTVDGTPLGSDPYAVAEPVTLDLPGLGQLRLDPGSGDSAERLRTAREALKRALERAGAASPDTARAAARTRAEAARQLSEAQETLKRLAPDGVDALAAEVARLAAQPSATDAPDLDAAQAALDRARAAETEAETRTAAQRARTDAAREAAIGARHDRDTLNRRRCEATEALAALPETAPLEAALHGAAVERATAQQALADLGTEAPNLDACRAALARATSVAKGAEDEIGTLRIALGGLDATVATLSGEGVEEDLADARLRLDSARATEAALRHEVAVLKTLIAALEEAQAQARDRYFSPVLDELRPMLRLLWPGAELQFDGDNLLPSALVRDGVAEPIGTLSGGTREQIALLVRLAFARLLARSGRHAPVILDDALVYTDDDRIEVMFDALHAQASDLQILVLSCRNRALRALGGRKLAFEPVDPTP